MSCPGKGWRSVQGLSANQTVAGSLLFCCVPTVDSVDHAGNSLLPALEKSINQFDQV